MEIILIIFHASGRSLFGFDVQIRAMRMRPLGKVTFSAGSIFLSVRWRDIIKDSIIVVAGRRVKKLGNAHGDPR